MQQMVLGRTGLRVGRSGFGCIPIQRVPFETSTALLRHAYDNGVTLFDTATAYTTSEERIGIALESVRKNVVLATKTYPLTPDRIMANLNNSLKMMRTDYIDLYQVHNPDNAPLPGGEDGVYDTLLKAKASGKIRHIGTSCHRIPVAVQAVESGLYETLQFPLSAISTDEELSLIALCRQHNVGLIAMKAMAGGLLTSAKAAFAFLREYDNVIPIWGIERMEELNEFLAYEEDPPTLDAAMRETIKSDREALGAEFCRGCGYCLPCPADIPIPWAARMALMLKRADISGFLTEEWQKSMARIDNCTHCGHCRAHCPYGLDTPNLLKQNKIDYDTYF